MAPCGIVWACSRLLSEAPTLATPRPNLFTNCQVSGPLLVRGQRWYRRRPRILWDDVGAPLVRWFIARVRNIYSLVQPKPRRSDASSSVVERYRFDGEGLTDLSAFEALEEYFALQEAIVSEAEVKFPTSE